MAKTVKKNKNLLELVKFSSDFNFDIAIVFDNSEYILLEEDLKQVTFYFIQQQLNLNNEQNGNIN